MKYPKQKINIYINIRMALTESIVNFGFLLVLGHFFPIELLLLLFFIALKNTILWQRSGSSIQIYKKVQ